MAAPQSDEKVTWFDKPSTPTHILYALLAACILLTLPDIGESLGLWHYKHPYPNVEGLESLPIFKCVFGFAAYSFIVLSAKVLRKVLMRGEDYYDN